MLRIRKKQTKELTKASQKSFEDRMVIHSKRFFPEQCKGLGPEMTLEAVRYSILQAVKYEIVSERDVCIFTDVMFAYGENFDTDPKLPWASQILNDENLQGEPDEKVDKLHEAAMKHAKETPDIPTVEEVHYGF